MLAPLAVLAGCLALAPMAHAGVGLGMAPTFPTNATAGDTGLPASLTLTNLNTAGDVQATVCNVGDALPCPAGDEGITLTPSCGSQGPFSSCTTPDPGVFRISPTATGAAGTACPGVAFTVTPLGDAFGKFRFTPAAGTHVVLPAPGANCRIEFTIDVLRAPTTDAQASVPGMQTIQVADATQYSNLSTTGSSRGSSAGSTVNPPPPPPAAPPPAPPPPGPAPCVPPPGPAPPGQMLCSPPVAPSSAAPGSAQIAGKTGCVTQNFDVTVTGTQIRRVTFLLDGRIVLSLTRPNRGSRWVMRVRPGLLSRRTHRVVADTFFQPSSATPRRRLRVVFQRCSRRVSTPRFTG